MTVEFDGLKKVCARLGVIGMVAFGATACSSIPDWVDPTTWIGGSSPSDNETAPGETPDLAAIPDRPVPATTSDEQQQVTQSLAADRSRSQYSAEALRGGTEPAAAPPQPPSQVAANDVVVPQNSPPTSPAPAPDTTSSESADTGTVDATAHTAPPPSPSPPPAASELPPAAPSASNAQTSAYTPPPPAPPVASVSPSDAALGFKPSTAPPLDASVGQFVPQPIIARYNQTASAAGTSPRMVAMAQPTMKMKSTGSRHAAVGGPEAMSGAVVANLEALQAPSTNQAAVYSSAQGLPPAAVVLFPGDGALLNNDGRAQVRAAVDAFKQAGGQGYVRVVGHASSRTSNMPVEKHLEVIFNKSQDRANAVAKELIREGVPANHVLVEAVGDSQPVYYESMPKGEDGNRRAEIFLQS
jgi:outer membrane protein OmpA-like peptidoglycan-associated protein